MFRSPAYDDGYITRKLASLQTTPTYLPHIPPYGRTSPLSSGYYQPLLRYRPRSRSLSPSKVVYYYPRTLTTNVDHVPVPRTRVRYRSVSPVRSIVDYSPLPVPRTPRLPPPSYYDYDYGYGGAYSPYIGYPYGYGYGYSLGPRMSRLDSYLEDDEVPSPGYTGRYGRATRLADSIVELEREKQARRSPVRTVTTTTYALPEFTHTRSISPRMLQDEVDKLRYKMKGLSYTMDTSEPTPSVSQRSRRANSVESARRYTSGPKHLACVEYAGGVPQWKRKARSSARYPSEDPESLSQLYKDHYQRADDSTAKEPEKLVLKDRLSMKIHNYLTTSLEPEKFDHYLKTYREPGPIPTNRVFREALSSTYTSKHPLKTSSATTATAGTSKWEEPSTIYSSSDKQPFSKTRETTEDEPKKERAKKKKSREYEEPAAPTPKAVDTVSASEMVAQEPASAPVAEPAPAAEPVSAEEAAPTPEVDEKELKRLEKKKRKAEREAAAKAAMEAELAALAAAEAEIAQLEAQAAPPVPAPEDPVETPVSAPEPEVPAQEVVVEEQTKCELPDESVPEANELPVETEEMPVHEPEPSVPEVESEPPLPEAEETTQTLHDEQTEDTGIVSTDDTNVVEQEPVETPFETQQEPIESDAVLVDETPIDSVQDTAPYTEGPVELAEDTSELPVADSDPVAVEPVDEISADDAQVTAETEPENVESESIEPENVEPEYVEPARKGFQAETTFDWDEMGDSEEQIGGGTSGKTTGGGSAGVTEEPTSPVEEQVASPDNVQESEDVNVFGDEE